MAHICELRGRRAAVGTLLMLVLQAGLPGCSNPYRSEESGRNIFYSSYYEAPKHLDPAISYSEGEARVTAQIYEPPLQYHYLKRPYELLPLTALEVPLPAYYGEDGEALPGDPPASAVAKAVYTVRIKPGIYYQPHPCFARDESGRYAYHDLDGGRASQQDEDRRHEISRRIEEYDDVEAFPIKDTRELIAADYVYQIKRLAHPRLHCPIFSTMTNYIVGLDALGQELSAELSRIRQERRRVGGVLFTQEIDEGKRPIWLDLDRFDLAGVRVVDRYTYQIELSQKYPQFAYWLAMPFFCPVPREADRFFAQAPLVQRNLSLDNRPIGTGPYRMAVFVPQKEIVLVRNENYRAEEYPSEGEPEDRIMGLLADAGRAIPFIETAVYKYEKEAVPRWSKFLQGYYETSGISTEVFDQAIQSDAEGGLGLSDELQARGVRLLKSVRASTAYFAFNMEDDVVGGYTEGQRKLRQALSIAVDMEEWIQIFLNDRGMPAQDPLPPGIFGHRSGRQGMNPFVYRWDETADKAVRRSVKEARQLLAEAGYAGGKDSLGNPLVLYFDTYWTGASAKARTDWLRKQLAKLDIDLQIRQSDYNRFQDKVRQGNFQILFWGWNADYPDPENFLFLLYGPNGRAKLGGENTANYASPHFDRLFKEIESMQNSPERMALLADMLHELRRDAPWIWGYHPVSFGLYHEWYRNAKPMAMGRNTLKYQRLDPQQRERRRREWNRPVWWPLALAAALLAAGAVPAVVAIRRRERQVDLR